MNNKSVTYNFFACSIIVLFIIALSYDAKAEQPWFYYYKLGIENHNKGQYELALTALDKAIELNPTSSSRARTYGMNYIEYYPYLYRTACLVAMGKYGEAKATLDREFDQGAINDSKDTLNKAYLLKSKIESALQPPKVVQQEKPIEKKPPPVDDTSTQITDNKLPREDAKPSFLKETQTIRSAIVNYFNGEYSQTITQLNQLPDDIPPHLKNVKHFFLGCSHAALYYLKGEKDKQELQNATASFGKVRMLPMQMRNRFGKLISPKIITLFQNSQK
ncbi:MAG: hypothetical protein A2Y62_00115 [Candidatus Fischerbacteria bacterium RBG_13_37_8]|uniref:Uncharacterized protein n=1 Tax=Candidatus Fischerbacteria bacterium RBG_13_37_8 TaxID=1817863 RepID=A0A1F5V8Y9_9BACT|nr:MAG: hypothetical protein A2Y62_00115 [Candidatus Fischerbacteria bacterium RBG_13_37_8]